MPVTDYLYTAMLRDDTVTMADRILELTPPDSTILMLWEQRTLYIPRKTVIGTPFFQERFFTPPETVHTPDNAMDTIRRSNATHVLIALESKSPDEIPECLERCRPVFVAIAELARQHRLSPVCRGERWILCSVSQ